MKINRQALKDFRSNAIKMLSRVAYRTDAKIHAFGMASANLVGRLTGVDMNKPFSSREEAMSYTLKGASFGVGGTCVGVAGGLMVAGVPMLPEVFATLGAIYLGMYGALRYKDRHTCG